MSPKDTHQRNPGATEPLDGSLRDMILNASDTKPAPVPGLPPQRKHKTGTATRDWSRGALTKTQKGVLCQIAGDAYATQAKHGLIDEGVKLDAWRRAEQAAAVGIASLSDCRQAHYKPLRGHFLALAGKQDVGTFEDLVAEPNDPYRLSMSAALREELQRFAELPDIHGKPTGDHRAEAYLFAIAEKRGRLVPRTVATICETWEPKKIETLVYTMRNRNAAKRDVGSTGARNKSQRKRD